MQCKEICRIFRGRLQSKARIDFLHFWRCYRTETRGLEGIKALSVLNLSSEKKNPASAPLRHTLPFWSLACGNIVWASNGLREWPTILQSWIPVQKWPKAFWEYAFSSKMWICPRVLGHGSVLVQQFPCFPSCCLPMVMFLWIFSYTKISCLQSLCS